MPGDIKIWTLIVAGQVATPAMAELRPMPEYFVTALVSTSAAQAVALSCPALSVNPVAVVRASETLLEQLEADGFDPSDPASGMDGGNDILGAQQKAFIDKHALDGAGADQVCAAGLAEIAEGTAIGQLLVEEAQ